MPRPVSLRVGLVTSLLVLLAPALLLVAAVSWDAEKTQMRAAEEHALQVARLFAVTQAKHVEGTHHLLAALAEVPALISGDREACEKFLQSTVRGEIYEPYTGIGLFKPNGDMICFSTPVDRPANSSDREWFNRVMETGEFAIGGYQIGRVSGSPIIGFGYPVRGPAGETKGVLLAALSIRWLGRMIEDAELHSHATVTVLDRAGIIVARYPDGEELVGQPYLADWRGRAKNQQEGVVAGTDVDGVPRLFGFARLGKSGATVIVGEDKAVAAAAIARVRTEAHAWIALLAALGAGAAWFGAAKILRPVERLLAATRRLDFGDLGARVGEVGGTSELRALAKAFDDMAGSLASREAALRASEQRLAVLLHAVGEGIFGVDTHGTTTFANAEALRLTGWSDQEIIGKELHALVHHSRADNTPHPKEDCLIWLALSQGSAYRQSADVFWRCDGTSFPVEYTVTAIPGADGPEGAVLIFRDVTGRNEAEERLRRSEARFRLIFDSANDAVFFHELNGRFIEVNQIACERLGYRRDELLDLSPRDIQSPEEREAERRRQVTLLGRGQLIAETEFMSRDGSRLPVEISSRLVEYDGRLAVLSFARDITERKTSQAQIRHMAHHDLLTDLPNRALFDDRLEQAIAKAKRRGGKVALLYVDLDRFKAVNDTLGHRAGDLVLQEAARRMRACVRESDTVARLGGDEFALVLQDVADGQSAAAVAAKIVAALVEPYAPDGHEAIIGASIGMALYPEDESSRSRLVTLADAAMYRAKENGGNRHERAVRTPTDASIAAFE